MSCNFIACLQCQCQKSGPNLTNLKLTLKETFRELIDENLEHIISACKKPGKDEQKVSDTAVATHEAMKAIRKKLADECKEAIEDLVIGEFEGKVSEYFIIEGILDIIRGDK